jgi:hypothetical protein
MENKIIKIKLMRKHGLCSKVSKKTGISMPTVKKYLEGDIYYPKAIEVINEALNIIENAK